MKAHYAQKAKKNKKLRHMSELLEKPIDTQVLDLQIKEYQQNVLWRYFSLKYFIHFETKKYINFLQKNQPNLNVLPESIYLPQKASAKVYFEMKRINHTIDLLFSETKFEHPIGQKTWDESKPNTLAKIMHFTKYTPKTSKSPGKNKKKEKSKKIST